MSKLVKVKALKKFLFNARMIEIGQVVEMDYLDAKYRVEQLLVKELKTPRKTKEEKQKRETK